MDIQRRTCDTKDQPFFRESYKKFGRMTKEKYSSKTKKI